MKKILPAIIFFSLISSIAYAKVSYNNKQLAEVQAETVKGFLYDLAQNGLQKEVALIWKPKVAKTIVWLNRVMASKKVFQLETLKNDEALVVKDSIDAIIDVIKGKYPNVSAGTALTRWTSLGRRVIAEYKEKDVKDPQTGKNKKIVYWKLKLKKEKRSKQKIIKTF